LLDALKALTQSRKYVVARNLLHGKQKSLGAPLMILRPKTCSVCEGVPG